MSGGVSAGRVTHRLAAAGLTATTILLLTAGLSMLQPLSTDLYLSTLPGIATYFNASVASVQSTLWIFIAAFGVWQLVAGPLSDRFGRYPIVVAGAFTYCAASVLAMLAPSLDVLIAGRMLQAVGACTCLVGARGFVRDLYTPTEGARMVANAATLMSLAPLIGPLIGAALYVRYGWRSSFALLVGAFAGTRVHAATFEAEGDQHAAQSTRAQLGANVAHVRSSVASHAPFRAYTLSAAATYACLFTFLSGSSFVLIDVLGQTPTSFRSDVRDDGHRLCDRHADLPAVVGSATEFNTRCTSGATLQAVAGVMMAALALGGVHVPAAIGGPIFFLGVSHGLIQPPVQSAPWRRSRMRPAPPLHCLASS